MLKTFMPHALAIAEEAGQAGEVPVAAVVVRGDDIIATASNRVVRDNDPTAHAEILALRSAAAVLKTPLLTDCDMWVTLEPCAMCASAIAHARIPRLYFAASDAKSGGVIHGARVFTHPQTHHKPEVYDGIEAEASAKLLKAFFQARR